MPQLMCEPTATLMNGAGSWKEEEWVMVPRSATDTVRAYRAAETTGNGKEMDRTFSGQPFGFLRGNRLVKDIVLGLYDQALVGGESTLQTINGVKCGWSSKSALADLLATRYTGVWQAETDGKWTLFEADGTTVKAKYDTLREAVLGVIKGVVRALNAHRTEVS